MLNQKIFLITLFGWLGASLSTQSADTGVLTLGAFALMLGLACFYGKLSLEGAFLKKMLATSILMFLWSSQMYQAPCAEMPHFYTWRQVEADIAVEKTWLDESFRLHVQAKLHKICDLEGHFYPELDHSPTQFTLKKGYQQGAIEQELWSGSRWSGRLKMSPSKKIRFKPDDLLGNPFSPSKKYFALHKYASWIHSKWRNHVHSLQKEYRNKTTLLGEKLMVSMLGAGYCGPRVDFLLGRFGLKHLTAISGLHFSIVMAALFFLFIPCSPSLRLSLAALGATAFLLATGFSASSARAWLMAMLGCYCLWQGREYDALKALCLSALFWLILFPQWSTSAGFILSYLCAFFLILLASFEKLHPSLTRLEKVTSALGWQTVLFLSTAPLLLYWFHALSWLSLPANILISPLLAFSFLLAAAACALFWLSPLSSLLWQLATLLSQNSLDLLDSISLRMDQTIYYELSPSELALLMTVIGTLSLFFINQTFANSPQTQE